MEFQHSPLFLLCEIGFRVFLRKSGAPNENLLHIYSAFDEIQSYSNLEFGVRRILREKQPVVTLSIR